jgi:hypothetical protein
MPSVLQSMVVCDGNSDVAASEEEIKSQILVLGDNSVLWLDVARTRLRD